MEGSNSPAGAGRVEGALRHGHQQHFYLSSFARSQRLRSLSACHAASSDTRALSAGSVPSPWQQWKLIIIYKLAGGGGGGHLAISALRKRLTGACHANGRAPLLAVIQ